MTDHTPSGLPQPQTVAETIRDALSDMLNGWKYIRSFHGDLYGVGWDRAQDKAEKALELLPALSAPAVETVAVQEAIADERKSWADASAHDKEIASLALDCLAHRLTCRTPLPVAPKAEPTEQEAMAEAVKDWTYHPGVSAQPVADRSAEEDRVRGEQTRFLNLVLDIRRVINWEKPLNGFEVVQELQEYIEGLSQGTRQAEPVALTDEQIIAAARTAKAAHWNLTDAGCVLIGRAVLAAMGTPQQAEQGSKP